MGLRGENSRQRNKACMDKFLTRFKALSFRIVRPPGLYLAGFSKTCKFGLGD